MSITVQEAAGLWDISPRRVRILCQEGRIRGAVRKGRVWLIPDTARKPSDGRVRDPERARKEAAEKAAEKKKRLKNILLIGTGGTIASVASADGLVPELSTEEILDIAPEVRDMCWVDCVQLLNLDSSNMRPEHWMLMAETIRKHYGEYAGFVITHGTDTMAYTAAALSYLIQDSPKPIVLTGAQKPAGEYGSDAMRNLTDAFICACDDSSCGVQIVFSGSAICGTRARKNYSKSFAAFGSINFPELARIEDGRMIRFIPESVQGPVRFYDHINPNVGLVKFVPGMRRDVLRYFIDAHDGIVVESFGVGGLPEYSDFYDEIRYAAEQGKLVVMTTQVPNEGSNLSLYRVGTAVKEHLNVLEAHDMTTEAAFAKLMWVLGQTRDFRQAEKLFYAKVAHDLQYYVDED